MPRKRTHRTGLSRLFVYARGKRGSLAFVSLLAAVSAAAPVAGWHLVEEAVDNGISTGNEERLLIVVLAYIGVNAAAWVLGTATWRGLASIGQRVVLELRRDLFDHLTSLSLRYFSQQKAGWIISRLTSDVDALSDVLNQGLTTLVVNTLTLVAAVAGLFLLDWRLGLVALCVLPPAILITRWFQRVTHVAASDVRTRIAIVTAQLAESVAGMAVIQAFNRERAFQAEFDELNDVNRLANVRLQKLYSVFFPAIEFLGVIATAAVLFAGRAHDRCRHARDRHAASRRSACSRSSSSRSRSSRSCTARCRRRVPPWTRSAPSSTRRSTSPTPRTPGHSGESTAASSSTA